MLVRGRPRDCGCTRRNAGSAAVSGWSALPAAPVARAYGSHRLVHVVKATTPAVKSTTKGRSPAHTRAANATDTVASRDNSAMANSSAKVATGTALGASALIASPAARPNSPGLRGRKVVFRSGTSRATVFHHERNYEVGVEVDGAG